MVGAGISTDPPANIATAKEIREGIIKFGAPQETHNSLLSLENIRYEKIIEVFRDYYDKEFKTLTYFDKFSTPNLIHHFLAEMIREEQYVMTTNFDNLIERAIGIKDPNLKVIITAKDYKKNGNPKKNRKKGYHAIYKLHGSLQNIKTKEKTKKSVIFTTDSLGKQMKGKLFSIGHFKEEFLKKACKRRTLVILGYSGGDTFDIVPTLLNLKKIKRIIWISHKSTSFTEKILTYKIKPDDDMGAQSMNKLNEEELLLYKLSSFLNTKVYKIEAHTGTLIKGLINKLNLKSEIEPKIASKSKETPQRKLNTLESFLSWLKETIEEPAKAQKYLFAAKIFLDYSYGDEAINCFQGALELFRKKDDKKGIAYTLSGLGTAYLSKSDFKTSKKFLRKAHKIFKEYEIKNKAFIENITSIGNLLRTEGKYEEALKYFNFALDYHRVKKKKIGEAILLNNIATVNESMGTMSSWQKALSLFKKSYKIFEELGELKRMATSLGSRAVVHSRLWQNEKAIKYAKQAYKIYEKLGSIQGLILQSVDLGRFHADAEKYDVAIKNFKNAIKFCKVINSKIQIPHIFLDLGRTYGKLDIDKGLTYYKKAERVFREMHEELNVAKALNESGDLLFNDKQYWKAIPFFEEALYIAKKLKKKQDISKIQEKLFYAKMLLEMGM